ncbi:MAG: ribosomal RNA small subunit methyltransferase I [Acidimicrobiia bacterium]|nr:MAG: ribosomal RNA small subunit methyltransferase I [Acidimicrobiia bacterium]
MSGRLILCATPIGNLGDVPPRLIETLASVDLVYAEDTRRLSKLLTKTGVGATVRSYFVGNEAERSEELAGHLARGRSVALVTDAGTPGIADPGLSAVRAARRVGATVSVIPGPSAVTAALAVSGFPADRFVFEGFLPRRGAKRALSLTELAEETRTVVLFASPRRIGADLNDLAVHLGEDREVCIARELTKLHEEVWWGTLGEARDRWSEARGEITVVIAPPAEVAPSPEEGERVARRLLEEGLGASEAARRASAVTGVPRREIYRRITS